VSSFDSSQPIVGAYFFYWFDAQFLRSQTRTFDPFPVHAVDQDTQSFHDARWYVKQFSDMLDACPRSISRLSTTSTTTSRGTSAACDRGSCANGSGTRPRTRAPTPSCVRRVYAWGAAPFGFNASPELTIAQVGPGFRNTQLGGEGRIDTPRRDGAYYEDNLRQAFRSGRKIMAIETWNELGEGSGILETVKFGRQYIDLTRRYVDLFKSWA